MMSLSSELKAIDLSHSSLSHRRITGGSECGYLASPVCAAFLSSQSFAPAQYLSVNTGASAIVDSLEETNGWLSRAEGDVAFQAVSPASAYVTTRRLTLRRFILRNTRLEYLSFLIVSQLK